MSPPTRGGHTSFPHSFFLVDLPDYLLILLLNSTDILCTFWLYCWSRGFNSAGSLLCLAAGEWGLTARSVGILRLGVGGAEGSGLACGQILGHRVSGFVACPASPLPAPPSFSHCELGFSLRPGISHTQRSFPGASEKWGSGRGQ